MITVVTYSVKMKMNVLNMRVKPTCTLHPLPLGTSRIEWGKPQWCQLKLFLDLNLDLDLDLDFQSEMCEEND